MEFMIILILIGFALFGYLAYRQGIKDGYYIYNSLPLAKPKREKEGSCLDEYKKMMNYDFEMEGEEYEE